MTILARFRIRAVFAIAAVGGWMPGCLFAAAPTVAVTAQEPGASPFISFVHLHTAETSSLESVRFTIRPKPGSVTRPLSARYASAYLGGRGYLHLPNNEVVVPVFGLYAGYTNSVQLECRFGGGTFVTTDVSILTAQFTDRIFNHPVVVQARSRETRLSYDYIMLKSFYDGDSPRIIDTDGELRWVGTEHAVTMNTILYDNSIFFSHGAKLSRMELDGSISEVKDYSGLGVTLFHHNLDKGKRGILAQIDTPNYAESTVMEVDTSGNVLHAWNLAQIISNAMLAGSDDATQFVPAAGTQVDWFHGNSAAYRPADDTIVISSRENFVIALDYQSGTIKWILGDPTKQWHQFASLRRYALTATPGSHYPVGQHAVSFFRQKLLLFDDGYYSLAHTPAGENRMYSAPRKYEIDPAAGTATETWNYWTDIYSPICSSVYEDRANNYLVDYATAGPYEYAEIIGLRPGKVKVFDYKFTEENTAQTAWNAAILHLEDLNFE
jgi:arylsulfate sulfotransferase